MVEDTGTRRQREIFDLLLKEGLITPQMLEAAKQEAKRTGLSVEKALEKLGFISEENIVKVRASALGLPYMDLSDYTVDRGLTKLISENFAKRYKAVPLFKIGNDLTVGMVDPQDIIALDQIRKITRMEMIEPVLVSEKGIQLVLDTYYGPIGSIDEIIKSISEEKLASAKDKELAAAAGEAPIIRLVNAVIAHAAKDRASDIHVEPVEDLVRIRFRVDGLLNEVATLPKALQNVVISRIKILASMDIAESRRSQDGRIRITLEDKDLDIRVSVMPTIYGENVVMRLLDKSSVLLDLKDVGFSEKDRKLFDNVIRQPNGIVLVTGPTGSGKTSTLNVALSVINSIEKNIITIEDPVEYELPLIRQTQINPRAGITFASGLRSILRQDPDIIMVGEVRDRETVDIAIQAALTGHLVFTTLHTNDAPSALTRLIDMGVDPFLISSSVTGIIAQRLVRLICPKCKEKYQPPVDILKQLGLKKSAAFYRGKGCAKCKQSGFSGRTGIFEILIITEEIRAMVDARNSADEIRKKAIEAGMRTLRDDGLAKAREGLTTIEEVLRATEVE